MRKWGIGVLFIVFILQGLGASVSVGNTQGLERNSDFIPAPVPLLAASAPAQDQPLYVYLFTHTEDPFNHELSEERYLRFVPEVEARATADPEAHLNWTIMFQGSDAQTVAERNPQTGVVDLLRAANQAGVVDFGYHAHHDPTYRNRPDRKSVV